MIEADFHLQVNSLEKVTVWYAFWAEAQANPAYRERISRLEAHYFEDTRALFQRLIDEGGYRRHQRRRSRLWHHRDDGRFLVRPDDRSRELRSRGCQADLPDCFSPASFPGTSPACPAPAAPGAAIDALRRLQTERAQALAAFAEKERAALDDLARSETPSPKPGPPSDPTNK